MEKVWRKEERLVSGDRSDRKEERQRERGREGGREARRKKGRLEVDKVYLLKANIAAMHRRCSQWLQLKMYPTRTPRTPIQMPDH